MIRTGAGPTDPVGPAGCRPGERAGAARRGGRRSRRRPAQHGAPLRLRRGLRCRDDGRRQGRRVRPRRRRRRARRAVRGRRAGSGVATLEEALDLRAAGITAPVLCWLHVPGEEFAAGRRGRRRPVGVLPRAPGRRAGRRARRAGRPARLHLKADTGLGRNGAPPADWPGLVDDAAAAAEGGGPRSSGCGRTWRRPTNRPPDAGRPGRCAGRGGCGTCAPAAWRRSGTWRTPRPR